MTPRRGSSNGNRLGNKARNALFPWSAGNPVLGDDAGDESGRRDVESRMSSLRAGRRDLNSSEHRDLRGVSLLYRNLAAGPTAGIDGGGGCGHVEGDVMLPRQHGERIRSDLVGHVAIRSNTICAHDHGVDLSLLHEVAGHSVGDYGNGNPEHRKLPSGEPRTLQEWPS